MTMLGITKESLEEAVARPIPDMYLLIAKNSVLGLSEDGIAEILGVNADEIKEITALPEYQEVRIHVAAHHNNSQLERDFGWDDIETRALQRLGVKLDTLGALETETVLRIAAVANRASRTHKLAENRPLDSGAAGHQVKLVLSKRIIERLSGDGAMERETIQEVSLRGGSISNPSFAEIDQHLGISARPRIPSNLSFRQPEPIVEREEPLSLNSLDDLMAAHMAKRRNSGK